MERIWELERAGEPYPAILHEKYLLSVKIYLKTNNSWEAE